MIIDLDSKLDEVAATPKYSAWEEAFYQALPKDENGQVQTDAVVKLFTKAFNSVTEPAAVLSSDPEAIQFILTFFKKLVASRNSKGSGLSVILPIIWKGFTSSSLCGELAAKMLGV
jgi:hypothetical protein